LRGGCRVAKRIGKEYVALNPTRQDRHAGSFKVVIVGQGRQHDRPPQ
jgi:hypothetical protein